MTRHPPLMAKKLFQALVDAGIVPENTSRVVIDLNRGNVVMIYTEQYADERFLSVVSTIEGIEVRHSCDDEETKKREALDMYEKGIIPPDELRGMLS